MSSDPLDTSGDPRDAFFDVSGLKGVLGRRTGRSATAVLLFSVLRLLMMLWTTAILARLVPPGEQGLVALVMPVILIAAGLSEFGLAQAVVQRQHITHRVVSALFWVNITLGLVLTLGAMALSPLVSEFYRTPEVMPILIVLAPYILLSVVSVQYVAILRRRMQVRMAETCSFIGVVAAAVLSILAAYLGAGPWALVVQLLVSQGASLLCLIVVVRWIPSVPWKSALGEARSALIFGGYLSADRLLNELLANIQTVIIGRVAGNVEAGLFFRSNAIAQVPRQRIVSPLAGAFLPSLSRLQSDAIAFRSMYIRQVSRGNLIMMPLGLAICLAPDAIVLILLGQSWIAAIPILGWLGLRPLMALFASANTWVLVAMDKPKELLQARIISSLFLVAVLIIAARFDIVVFVASFVLAQALVTLVYMPVIVVRHTPVNLATIREAIAADVVFCICVSGAGAALRWWLEFDPVIEGILICGLIGVVQSARILAIPHYRQDVLRVLRR